MKTKIKQSNNIIKAAFPIFALFGGNAFATSRNFSASFNSKRGQQAPKVSVLDTNTETLAQNHFNKSSSPFSVFSKEQHKAIKSVNQQYNPTRVEFLKNNGLLSLSVSKKGARISGHTFIKKAHKSFSHDLADRNNSSGAIYTSGVNTCANPNIDFFSYHGNSLTVSYCQLYAPTQTGTNLSQCQVLHNLCMGEANHTHANQLPVELQKFEIE